MSEAGINCSSRAYSGAIFETLDKDDLRAGDTHPYNQKIVERGA